MNFLEQLIGKRTYIIAVLLAVLNLAQAFGWISVEQINAINTVLGALGLATIRSAVNRTQA